MKPIKLAADVRASTPADAPSSLIPGTRSDPRTASHPRQRHAAALSREAALPFEERRGSPRNVFRSTRNNDETDGRRQCVPLGPSGDRADGKLSAFSRPRFSAGGRGNQTFRRTGSPRLGGASRPIRTGVAAAGGGHLFAPAPGRTCRAVGDRAWQAEHSEAAPRPSFIAAPVRRAGQDPARPET